MPSCQDGVPIGNMNCKYPKFFLERWLNCTLNMGWLMMWVCNYKDFMKNPKPLTIKKQKVAILA
jgi:hypothetical protein